MLRYTRTLAPIALCLWLAACNPTQSGQPKAETQEKKPKKSPDDDQKRQGGDDSPITIADGSLVMYSNRALQPSGSDYVWSVDLPPGHTFHHMLEQESLAVFDLRKPKWTITIKSHNVTLTRKSASALEISANGTTSGIRDKFTMNNTVGPFFYTWALHHSKADKLDGVTINYGQGDVNVPCTGNAHCHLMLVGCHANGCS